MALGSRLKQVVQSNVNNFTNDLEGKAKAFGTNFANNALENILGGGAASVLKSLLKGPDSEPPTQEQQPAQAAADQNDWRVKLSLPTNFARMQIFQPLVETGGLAFPYTPTILVQHTANYDSLQPVHSNYPFPAYQSSQIEDIVITGDFFVENAKDAQYWVAMSHYLRTVTKMDYGKGDNAGTPPPIVFLTGYGDFVFPRVPVVIRNFTFDLPADVDYIKTQVSGDIATDTTTPANLQGPQGFVPTQSQVSITVTPVYSRSKVSQFSLQTFTQGGYIGKGQGSGGGFI